MDQVLILQLRPRSNKRLLFRWSLASLVATGLLGIPGLLGMAIAAPAPAAPPTAVAGLTTAQLDRALEQLPGLITTAMQRTGVPGIAVVVVHNDATVFLEGFGSRRLGSTEPVDADTVFQLASVSKPITSSAIAAVVSQGGISWDTPVMQHLPETVIGGRAIGPKVTLRDLLSHRSGLPDHAGDELEDIGFDRATVLARLGLLDTGNRFRAEYAYTNFGFTAAAEATARATGRPWHELTQEQLFRPLGMTRTSSLHADFIGHSNRADLHQLSNGTWTLSPGRQSDAQSPAGGVSSTVRDLATWMKKQLKAEASSALAETHRPQMISTAPADPARDQAQLYGLGWNVGRDRTNAVRLSHSGAFNLGAATAITLLPAEGLGIAVLTNGSPIGVPESISAAFLDLVQTGEVRMDYLPLLARVFAQLLASTYPVVTAPPAAPALPLGRYTGTYRNAYVGTVEVIAAGNALQLLLGPDRLSRPLTSLGQHRFSYEPIGENNTGPSAVTFSLGPDGRPTTMRIDNLNSQGMGTLQRLREPAAGPPG